MCVCNMRARPADDLLLGDGRGLWPLYASRTERSAFRVTKIMKITLITRLIAIGFVTRHFVRSVYA